jgi:hypothetical protein
MMATTRQADFLKSLLTGGIAIWATAALTNAQSPPSGVKPPAKSHSLDQQLLDDLDRELLKDLPGVKQPADAAGLQSSKPGVPNGFSAKGAEGDDTPIESKNPLAMVAQRMRTVESRIARHDTSATTQEEQDRIIDDLDALLVAAKKGRGGGKQGDNAGSAAQAGIGAGDTPAGPPRDSTSRIEHGSKEPVETADVKDVLRRFWGHLPQKLRDQMQASFSEQFLPQYERVIEEYYKRLAEEPPGGQ